MANENVQKFEELLRSDDEIQAKLRAAVAEYFSDESNEQAVFETTIGKVAAEVGLPFSFEEGKAYAMDGAELSDTDLEAVAGGGFCYVIGGSDGPDADVCEGRGEEYGGAGACAFVGTSVIGF